VFAEARVAPRVSLDRYPQALAVARPRSPPRIPSARSRRVQALKTLAACARSGTVDDARRHTSRRSTRPANVHPNHAAAMLDNLALVEHALATTTKRSTCRAAAAIHRSSAMPLSRFASTTRVDADRTADFAAGACREGLRSRSASHPPCDARAHQPRAGHVEAETTTWPSPRPSARARRLMRAATASWRWST
jgi:hypothetical protein